jgi:hypothetical protein
VRNGIIRLAGIATLMLAVAAAAGCGSSGHQTASSAPASAPALATPMPAHSPTKAQIRYIAKIHREMKRQQQRQAAAAARKAHREAVRTARAEHEAHQVEYIVTGTPGADVQYGPSGSNLEGASPMDITQRLRHPQYYAISAQLQGSGEIRCELKIGGKVISRGQASGGYNIATCEASQGLYGGWTNDN